MSQEDFAARLTNYYLNTPVPKLDVNDWDLTQILPALFKSLSPGSPPRVVCHYEAGIQVTTILANDAPCFNLVSVSTDDHPVDSWWGPFMANKAPHRHRPEVNQFLSLGGDWTFSDDLWALIFERCRDSGAGWWALTTPNFERCLLGVFARDWKTLVTAPVASTHDDIVQSLAYWADCAGHSESPSSPHLKRPDDPRPTSEYNPIPPSRIARLLDQASQPSSPFTRNTRSRTVARKAFVEYDEKTGEPTVVPLGSSHVEAMRIKSAWMRTGDELSEKHGVSAISSVDEIIYGVTEEEGYNDPDMAMDVDPCPGLSFESPFCAPSWGQNLNSGSNSRTARRPLVLDRVKPTLPAAEGRYFVHHSRIEHLHKWHREHFSHEDDLDRSHTMAY